MAEENTSTVDTTTDDTSTTVLDSKPADTPEPKVTAPADWPEDWRAKAAGGDEKKLAQLSRFASPQALADSFFATRAKLSETRPLLTKDAKPEELAAYREALGIPDTPEKYDLNGIEIDEAEKPLISKFLASAHEAHMTPEQVRKSIAAYSELSEASRNDRLAKDQEVKTSAEEKLRADWGSEYRPNINLITNFLDSAPAGLREQLMRGRLADGTPIGSSVEALQWLAGLARERNPVGVITPSGQATESAVADELSKIRKTMRDNRAAYNRDEKMQARYRELVQWEAGQRSRAA